MMRILCAADLSSSHEVAVERATLIADQLAADLALVHAGNPARIIVETLQRSKAKLLVVGRHRKRRFRDLVAGSIADQAVAARHCPVLLVGNEVSGSYRRVLLALDLSDASATAVRATEALVLDRDADARVVHVHTPPYQGMLHYADAEMRTALRYPAGWERAAKHGILDLLRYEGRQCARYDIHVEQQPEMPAILRSMERYEPDLIVMGDQGGGRIRRAFVRSLADRVLQKAECDMLIVPEGSFGALRSRLFLGVRSSLATARESQITGAQPTPLRAR